MLIFFSLNINAYACDFIKVPMGTLISAIEDQYDDLPDTSSDEWGSETLKYNYDTSNFCDDELLKNSYMNIFVKEKKLIGIEIEGIEYESIEITTPAYGDFLILGDVVEMNQ